MGEERVRALVEPYFGEHWQFSSEKERKGLHAVGLSRAFCQLFPLTLNERVEATCKLHYLLVLVDGKSTLTVEELNLLTFLQINWIN